MIKLKIQILKCIIQTIGNHMRNFYLIDKHIQSKKETYTVEGYNASFRDDLRRLTRKTRAYSKSQDMLKVSLNLYIAKHNQTKLNELLSI